jgi:2-polyprenyl-3-methyl-5-hydroxy-6-metoxy-1,4-benzoquinol methylase
VCGGSYTPSPLPGLLQCGRCGFISADLELSDAEIRRLYAEDYFKGAEYHDYVADRATIQKHFRARLRRLLRYVPDAANRRLFEIGAAYGFFLDVARGHFRDVGGIDISADAARYAREELGLAVDAGDFMEARIPGGLDVVCLWDTIEHLQHPSLYVEKVAAEMQPGGLIAVTTGDISSRVARWRGSKWRQIHPPTHLHYFSRQTLTRLLERSGFAVTYVGYDGGYRSVDMMAYILLAIKRDRADLYRLLKRTGVLDWTLYLNLYDIIYVIARRT